MNASPTPPQPRLTARGLIFDYGGTLDTGGRHWARVFWQAYQQRHVPVTEAQFREAYVYAERTLGRQPIIGPHFTFRETLQAKVRLQASQLPVPVAADAVAAAAYATACRHTAHSREVLLRLKDSFPMVLVSNFYGNIGTVLREFGFSGIFEHVVESAVVGVRKPDPQIFTLGVQALGLPPQQVVVVGDSIDKDMLPARQAGCQTVWMRGQGWTDDEPDATSADRVIDDLEQLLTLLAVPPGA